MSDTFVVGVGMTAFGKWPRRTIHDLVAEAVGKATTDAGCPVEDVGSVFFACATSGMLQGQTSIPGPVAMQRCGIRGVPVHTVENACASGSSAFSLAAQSVRAGACDIALAVGVEKMHVADKSKVFAVFDGAWDVSTIEDNKQRLLALGEGVEIPPGSTSPNPYSVFMDVYASFARHHMRSYGTTQRQFAAVASKNRAHSVHNPLAQFTEALTVEQVLASPPITYPLNLAMCSPISDGAAAVVLCNARGLKRLGGASRAVRLLASVVTTGIDRSPDEPQKGIAHRAAIKAYDLSGVSPRDIDVAEVHDATAVGEVLNAEALCLARFGEGGPAAERGDFSIGGRIPINPSGGLESRGHPIGATGLAQVHELVTQLRGDAGARQVDKARIAIQENGGGLIGIEEAVVAVNVFAKS